jgi:hypothetical protein
MKKKKELSNIYLIPRVHATRVKTSHIVTSLPTSRQQVVFELLVSSCQQV